MRECGFFRIGSEVQESRKCPTIGQIQFVHGSRARDVEHAPVHVTGVVRRVRMRNDDNVEFESFGNMRRGDDGGRGADSRNPALRIYGR